MAPEDTIEIEKLISTYLIIGKGIGAGLATIGLAGAGVGVGVVFGSLLLLRDAILWNNHDYLNLPC